MAVAPNQQGIFARTMNRLMTALEPTPERVLGMNADGDLEHYGVDLLGQQYGTGGGRRSSRSSSQLVASHAAVFAAIRFREQAITRPKISLEQRVGGVWQSVGGSGDPAAHVALGGITRVNKALTFSQGFGQIERGKLQNGDHFWIKRRDAIGVPMEYEVWDGATSRAVARADRPWEPAYFEQRTADGKDRQVAPEDVIWFRHIPDLADPMRSLTPIAAIRQQADTDFEARRYNQRMLDSGIGAGGFLKPAGEAGIGQGELDRIKREIETNWKGADNAGAWHLIDKNLELLAPPQSLVDLQFVDLMKWSVIEVARAFELSPPTLKDLDRATYENIDKADRADWTTIENQLDSTLAQFNEFLIRPDFGEDLRLVADYTNIPALQEDAEQRAKTDDIRIKNGTLTINEQREREGFDAVDWGDVPIMPVNVAPLGTIPTIQTPAQLQTAVGAEPPDPRNQRMLRATQTPNTAGVPGLLKAERAIENAWAERLREEMERIVDFIVAEAERSQRVLSETTVDAIDWNWLGRHLDDVTDELAEAMEVSLVGAGFIETPLLPAHQLAVEYARNRAASMLAIDGPFSVTDTTRRAVRTAVASAVAEGKGPDTLRNELMNSHSFSRSRAETIARTETATAQGQGAKSAARSQGRDEKRWQTAGDDRVDAGGGGSQPCITAEGEGWVAIDEAFANGHDTIPAHPRCRCDVEYRTAP